MQCKIIGCGTYSGFYHLTWSVQPCICTLNSRHFAYRTSRTTCICTLTLSTLLVEHISSIRINRMAKRSRWKFRICITVNDLTLYSFSSLYIFMTWGWPTVAETCRQPNKTDTKTVVFWRTYPLLTHQSFQFKYCAILQGPGTRLRTSWGTRVLAFALVYVGMCSYGRPVLLITNMWTPKLLGLGGNLKAEKHLVITTHISIFLLTRELPTWSRVLIENILPILKCMVALVASPCIWERYIFLLAVHSTVVASVSQSRCTWVSSVAIRTC